MLYVLNLWDINKGIILLTDLKIIYFLVFIWFHIIAWNILTNFFSLYLSLVSHIILKMLQLHIGVLLHCYLFHHTSYEKINYTWQKCTFHPYVLPWFSFWSLHFILSTFNPYLEKNAIHFSPFCQYLNNKILGGRRNN